MGEASETTEQGTVGGGYRLAPWNVNGAAALSASAQEPEGLLLAGLQGVLAAVRDGGEPTTVSEEEASAAAPIRGQGTDVGAVFAELAADLLAQVDANGPGLDRVRLDGVLATDDGGYTAWGYAMGLPAVDPPPVGITLDGDPIVAVEGTVLRLTCTLRRA
ncbi:MAG: hypothetical protein AVDCRST_MAG19-1179 [uncultured Thermomicrobiales bacterium]|uniref:Uncharacterized protein n=1 Tax=uncultured Thermomicrobiales bacterium TaxID=1645740 RepID=A0A6J4UN01_9BACT|nr:MAG: hypothetical protein AVDCRST_MAG19-1179 [uncultured Thermomicrobiales bacterium]